MNDAGDCYYAVIFTAEMADNVAGYADMVHRMNVLVEKQPGYMGRSDRTEGKRGITISYWQDRDSIEAWKQHPEHQAAQALGRSTWYKNYAVEIVKIQRGSAVQPESGNPWPEEGNGTAPSSL